MITLAILAGGNSTRMGAAKSHLVIHGQPILEYLLRRFNWTGPTLLVTAPHNQHPPGRELFGREVSDPIPDQGPLRGILTALEAATTDTLLITTVDMPNMTQPQLLWIVDQLSPSTHAVMLRNHRDQIEPFPMAIRKGAIASIVAQLQSNRRSVHSLAAQPSMATRPAPADWPADTWLNLNFPEDLTAYLNLP